MLDAFADLLWVVMKPCYEITGNWWASIFIFTCIFRVVTFPISLWVQHNAISMLKFMPKLNAIKLRYFGDNEAIGSAQAKLYKESNYHPLLSLLPLVIQILVLIGLVHLMHGVTTSGAAGTDFLGSVPYVDGGIVWIMPLLAGASAFTLGLVQNKISPLQREQEKKEQRFTNGISIAISLVLGVFVSAGMAFYWICSNLTTILVQLLANLIMQPKKKVDYVALKASQDELHKINEVGSLEPKRRMFDELSRRERADYKRFFCILNKHIVFYSEGSGFYKYFKGAIEYLLSTSDVPIHYISHDPKDQIFELAKKNDQIKPYYIGQKKLIPLMMKMDSDVVVLSTEDLENYYIKRSLVKDDVKYIFMFHHMTSTHLTALEQSYDHYDTILCAGPHQIEEIRAAEKMRNLPAKQLVECGYPLLDEVTLAWEERQRAEAKDSLNAISLNKSSGPFHNSQGKKLVLIAPSWQEDCILDICFDDLIKPLLDKGLFIIVRPHPEYTKRYSARWETIKQNYSHVSKDELYFEKDFSSNESVLISDILITDWSSIFCEYCFSSNRPVIFIDTPMKIGNENWEKLGIEPSDISLRNKVGVSLSLDNLSKIYDHVEEMIDNKVKWQNTVSKVGSDFIFNRGNSAKIAGEFLLSELLRIQDLKIGKPSAGVCSATTTSTNSKNNLSSQHPEKASEN